eukprot:GHVN01055958.1.p2 GENE.GHVN01055958.1~~GHVN01055958.1.p2  ORF type:complete len:134 (-),score=3.95 GHVN01055958.1:632-1033(-)
MKGLGPMHEVFGLGCQSETQIDHLSYSLDGGPLHLIFYLPRLDMAVSYNVAKQSMLFTESEVQLRFREPDPSDPLLLPQLFYLGSILDVLTWQKFRQRTGRGEPGVSPVLESIQRGVETKTVSDSYLSIYIYI